MKKQFLFFVLAFALLFLTGAVRADSWNLTEQPSINSMSVLIEGNSIFQGECVQVPGLDFWNCNTEQLAIAALERGNEMPIKVVFIPGADLSEVQIRAWISGYHDDIEVKTSQFDVFAGNVYTRTLNMQLPNDLDALDTYSLHVKITQKRTLTGIESADLDTLVQRTANQIKILNAEVFGTIPMTAGNTVYVDVVVKNIGNHEVDDVFVKASIKELGVSRTVYIGDLSSEDDCSSGCDEEDSQSARIALTIPENAKSGVYLLEVEAFGDSISDKVVKTIYVEKTQVTDSTSTGSQGTTTAAGFELSAYNAKSTVEAGKGTAFSVMVSNPTTSTITLTLAALGTEEWASSQINPSVITLAPGESKTATVYIVVKENAVSGDHIFTVKATSGANSKTVNLTAAVEGSKATLDMKTILMIAGIVLALIIVVLLIVLLTKKKNAKLEETYY